MMSSTERRTKENSAPMRFSAFRWPVPAPAPGKRKKPLYDYVRDLYKLPKKGYVLPVPMMNIINGGEHADNNVDFQEFMIMPVGREIFPGSAANGRRNISRASKKYCMTRSSIRRVGDEGGFAPDLKSNEEALSAIAEAVAKAGYSSARISSSRSIRPRANFTRTEPMCWRENLPIRRKSSAQMVEFWADWAKRYPIVSIEDGLSEFDWNGWKQLTAYLGDRLQLVGDDLFVTNVNILKKGIAEKVCQFHPHQSESDRDSLGDG